MAMLKHHHTLKHWVNRVLLTLFCCAAAYFMALLAMLTMDNTEAAAIAPVCWFMVFVLLMIAVLDAMENPAPQTKKARTAWYWYMEPQPTAWEEFWLELSDYFSDIWPWLSRQLERPAHRR